VLFAVISKFAIGALLATTVCVVFVVVLLPQLSVTVTVTVLDPTDEYDVLT
jgi:hypothetical protein